MKPATLATALLSSSLLITTHAQLIPFFTRPGKAPARLQAQSQLQRNQHPMAPDILPGIRLPEQPSSSDQDDSTAPKGDVILSDVIGDQRQINIFAGFTRDISTVSSRLEASSLNTTVLAPLNSAIHDLPRKPWEDPQEYAAMGAKAYDGQDGEDRAHKNLRRFTEAHVVPISPWNEGEKVKTMGGSTVWWEMNKEGKKIVQPGNLEVQGVVSKVANGEVWVVKGVLNYAS